MAKNKALFAAINDLNLPEAIWRSNRMNALKALADADLTDPANFRKAVYAHRMNLLNPDDVALFPHPYDPNEEDILLAEGDGDNEADRSKNNFRALQQLAAEKRVLYALELVSAEMLAHMAVLEDIALSAYLREQAIFGMKEAYAWDAVDGASPALSAEALHRIRSQAKKLIPAANLIVPVEGELGRIVKLEELKTFGHAPVEPSTQMDTGGVWSYQGLNIPEDSCYVLPPSVMTTKVKLLTTCEPHAGTVSCRTPAIEWSKLSPNEKEKDALQAAEAALRGVLKTRKLTIRAGEEDLERARMIYAAILALKKDNPVYDNTSPPLKIVSEVPGLYLKATPSKKEEEKFIKKHLPAHAKGSDFLEDRKSALRLYTERVAPEITSAVMPSSKTKAFKQQYRCATENVVAANTDVRHGDVFSEEGVRPR